MQFLNLILLFSNKYVNIFSLEQKEGFKLESDEDIMLLEAMEEKKLYKFKKACEISQQEKWIMLKQNTVVYRIGNKLYELK